MQTATRRDFLIVSANVFPVVGSAIAVWPFLAQLNPDAQALSLATIDVDLAPVAVGQAVTVLWRGKAVFVRHRTEAEIEQARAIGPENLPDGLARNLALSEDTLATDANRVLPGHDE